MNSTFLPFWDLMCAIVVFFVFLEVLKKVGLVPEKSK